MALVIAGIVTAGAGAAVLLNPAPSEPTVETRVDEDAPVALSRATVQAKVKVKASPKAKPAKSRAKSRSKSKTRKIPRSAPAVSTRIPNYSKGKGNDVRCKDGKQSRSGGIQGACSSHRGVDPRAKEARNARLQVQAHRKAVQRTEQAVQRAKQAVTDYKQAMKSLDSMPGSEASKEAGRAQAKGELRYLQDTVKDLEAALARERKILAQWIARSRALNS